MNLRNNELADNLLEASIESNSSPASISWSFSFGPIPAPIFIFASASILVKYINEDLQKATKLTLKSFF